MPGCIEALSNIKPRRNKHEVVVEGHTVEVTLDKKIEMIRNGVENYYFTHTGELVLRERKNKSILFPEIEKFIGNPYWPEDKFLWKK